jgi:hypothetical protein
VLISFAKNWNLLIVIFFFFFNFLQLWLNQYQVEFWFKCDFLVSDASDLGKCKLSGTLKGVSVVFQLDFNFIFELSIVSN